MLRAMSGPSGLWLGAVATIGITGCAPAAQSQQTIVLKPGQDLENIVAHAPEGTRFLFEPGIYRQQTIGPKNRQEFIGQGGAILSGAMVLANWTADSGRWRHEGLPESLPFEGECADGTALSGHREICSSMVGSTNEWSSSTTWARGDRTTTTIAPIWPTIRGGI